MNINPKRPDTSVEEISIVLIGHFNPMIFHPAWFAKEDLLRESEASDARIEVVHQDLTTFSTDWLSLNVTRDRFVAKVKADAYRSHLGDLVLGVFQKLVHTPVRQMGINVEQRIHFKTDDDWHAFGHFIMPKSPWKEVATDPGLRVAHVKGRRLDDRTGHILFMIQPDAVVEGDALIRVNDHYEIKESDRAAEGAGWAVSIIQSDYEDSLERAFSAINQLIENFVDTKVVDAG